MDIKIFESQDFGQIRTVEVNGEPYFVGKDVATVLGYSNPSKAINDHVDSEDITTNDSLVVNGMRMLVINESGLYSLILSSKLPTAKQFKRWVTAEVIPSIRKHGAYMTPEVIEQTLTSPDFIIKLATELKAEQTKVKSLQPKAEYCDAVLNTPDLIPTTVIAKDYGKSAIWLNNYLWEKSVQYKQGGTWVLYQKYANKGLTSTKTTLYTGDDGTQHSKIHTYWTAKGREFIYSLLKADGFVPQITKEDALKQMLDVSDTSRQSKLMDRFMELDSWKEVAEKRVRQFCEETGHSYSHTMKRFYNSVERTAKCDLGAKLKRIRGAMEKQGASYKERACVTKLDVISENEKLKKSFDVVVLSFINSNSSEVI
ncbi:MAG: phage antirepressor [Oscillospiraceae bacterium]|nr:phage antirepressor [Oscillospiraceae bacterium]